MKKLLLLVALFSSLAGVAQITAPVTSMTFYPFVSSRVRTSDSVQMQFILQSGKTVASIAVTQTAGPAVKFTVPQPTWSGDNAFVTFWLQGLAPGTYAFTAVGKDVAGNTQTVTESLTVVADPVCPTAPAPRVVASITLPLPVQILTILGQTITIPAQTITIPATQLPAGAIIYRDGSAQ